MLRLLLVCLALLAVLYSAKVALLEFVVPGSPGLAQEDGGGLVSSALGTSSPDEAASRAGASLTFASASGAGAAELVAGLAAFRRGDDSKALALYQRCIEEANVTSTRALCQTAIAELHLVGAGVQQNLTEAASLFEEAGAAGDPDAQYNLGILYAATQPAGSDLRQREALAVLHLYAASTAGHPGALMAMGYRHMHGYGVPQACTTAALNYIDVAKKIASVYSEGMPQAVELIRLNLHHKDRKVLSASEMGLFVQIATSGDTNVAAAIGKRYLLGIEGFKQDYGQAKHYLGLAATRSHPGALALLGYMHCLGLGTPQNLDMAYSYFVSAAAQNDALGHNGLGYIYFKGTSMQARNLRLAFRHFNESAFGGSSDGMFNLASMYLTGTGTEQSFQKAVLYYTQALDRGHTPAAYSLAVMHLNGIGTVRDCDIAVNLLKKVCERGEWVSGKLVEAYEHVEKQPDKAALLFLKLAEAGHEVAQMNAAHLFDSGQSSLLFQAGSADASAAGASDGAPQEEGDASSFGGEDLRHHSRTLAQRFYELSAEQGSASSELRLGDYSYYGWGVAAAFLEQSDEVDAAAASEGAPPGSAGGVSEEEREEEFDLPNLYTSSEVVLRAQEVDYEASLARYRKTADMTVTGEWMQGFVARGSFNLGFMHQFGYGVPQDLQTAKQHYHRSREVDPSGLHTPVTLVLMLLGAHMMWLRCPTWDVFLERLSADFRVHVLVLHLMAIASLAFVRLYYSRTPGQAQRRRPPPPRSAPTTPTSGGAGAGAGAGGSFGTPSPPREEGAGLRQRPASPAAAAGPDDDRPAPAAPE